MKLGLDTFTYHHMSDLTVDDYLQKADELGLDGVHMAGLRHLVAPKEGELAGLREKADSMGLYIELGTGGTDPDHLRSILKAAHVLGSPAVRTFYSTITKFADDRPTTSEGMKECLEKAAAETREVLPLCEEYGIPLAFENHQDLTTEELLTLIEMIDSEWAAICLDTGNSLALLDDPLEAAKALGSLTRSVHFKDYKLAARPDGFVMVGCALGEGAMDLDGILEVLARDAPEANLNIETPMEKIVYPVLEREHLSHLPGASAETLARTLRMVRDSGLPEEPQLPSERGASEQELRDEWEDVVVRSVRWARNAVAKYEAA
jgi:sugar phosphate isomerase/epimerase